MVSQSKTACSVPKMFMTILYMVVCLHTIGTWFLNTIYHVHMSGVCAVLKICSLLSCGFGESCLQWRLKPQHSFNCTVFSFLLSNCVVPPSKLCWISGICNFSFVLIFIKMHFAGQFMNHDWNCICNKIAVPSLMGTWIWQLEGSSLSMETMLMLHGRNAFKLSLGRPLS